MASRFTEVDGSHSQTPLFLEPISTNTNVSTRPPTHIPRNTTEWIVCQRLVTPRQTLTDDDSTSSRGACIETQWQVSFETTNSSDSTSPSLQSCRQRIAVYSGPSSNVTTLHVSLELPASAQPPTSTNATGTVRDSSSHNCLAWVNFPEQKFPVLCCLIQPNALCLWQVYPDTETSSVPLPSEGWTIPLPFDCATIVALPSTGLLLQRVADTEDTVHCDMDTTHDGFVLQGPPMSWKQRGQNDIGTASTLTPTKVYASTWPTVHADTSTSSKVSSMFTLHHPLEDVVPVMETMSDHGTATIADALEQVVWVGETTWLNPLSGVTVPHASAHLVVTYHSVRQRHAVWNLTPAPAPPRTPPLHQMRRVPSNVAPAAHQRNNDSQAPHNWGNWGDAVWDETSPPVGLHLPFGVAASAVTFVGPGNASGDVDAAASAPSDSAVPSFVSGRVARDQALADALGVARSSPRKSLGASSGSAATAIGGGGSSGRRTSIRTEVLTGSSLNCSLSHNANAVDVSQFAMSSSPAPTPMGSSTVLYPKISLTCLYCEEPGTAKTRADAVFFASNYEATGLLSLAMFTAAAQSLTFLSLEPTTSGPNANSMGICVKSVDSIPCLAATPVSAFPSPHRCVTGQKLLSSWIPDVLVLQEPNELALFRGTKRCVPCAIPPNANGPFVVTGIVDPVANYFTLQLSNEIGEGSSARFRLNVSLQRESTIAERILTVIDASLYGISPCPLVDVAMNVRIDCCRLRQSLLSRSLPLGARNITMMSLQTVLSNLLEYEVMGGAPKGGESTPPVDDPWQTLLQSDFHDSFMTDNLNIVPNVDINLGAEGNNARARDILLEDGSFTINALDRSVDKVDVLHRVFDSLHFLYEDLKLTTSSDSESAHVASLLVGLAHMVQMSNPRLAEESRLFLEYYRQDMGEAPFQSTVRSAWPHGHFEPTRHTLNDFKFSSFGSPPSILAWIEAALASRGSSADDDGVFHVKSTSINPAPTSINPACVTTRSIVRIFLLMQREAGPTRDAMTTLAMLEEGFSDSMSVQSKLRLGVALPLLEVLFRCRKQASSIDVAGWSPAAWRLVGRDDLSMNMTVLSEKSPKDTLQNEIDTLQVPEENQPNEDVARDGLVPLERRAVALFPGDNRVHEAARLLSSSRPIFLRVARAVEVSDHDFERLKQKQLLLLSYRSLALPAGRGMMTIGSLRLVPAEPLPLPDLCLKGRVPPTNATLNLDISDCSADMLVWPEFHNGVAAGLRLPADDELSHLAISRTWISFNKPPATRPAQPQETGDANPPPQAHSFSHGGLLFALGLRGHLTSLEMSDVYEYLTQGCATTTVGVLLGLAVNKRGSCDIAISKMLCLHIPSLIPQHFSAIDVASTVQTAAIAAAGLLFQGSSHRMMTEFLLNEIGKRPETDVNTCDREAYTLACGLALGTVNLCLGARSSSSDRTAGLADLRIEERLIRYIVGGVDVAEVDRTRESNDRFSIPNSSNGNDSERCSTIFESNLINTSVTAPGATLALGLLYMKTNNNTVASALALPDTHFLLEFVRADFLGLRVISRALILWDEVLPSDEWIDNQVPRVVRTAYQHMGNAAKSAFGMRSPVSNKHPRQDVEYDRRAVRQIYVHVVSAACFGLGLRFAGTGNLDAKSTVMKRILEMHSLREATDPVSVACRPEMAVLETCLGCAAISLAMIMAGTGDLDSLRVFKILRWRCDNESQYGIHMIYGMAIGLLFLGGGTCTLGREPTDIAAMLTAFFPRFPMSTSDNQYHLQALRHLYAIAVKRKDLCAIDIDTKENVDVTVEVTTEQDMTDPMELKLPCLLLNTDIPLKELRVRSDEYYPLELDISSLKGSRHFYVKRRNSHSSVRGSILSQRSSNGSLANVVPSSMPNQFLSTFTEHFGGRQYKTTWSMDSDFLSRSVRECLVEDTEETLGIYLAMRSGIRALSSVGAAARFLWDFRLIRTYYQQQREHGNDLSVFDVELLLPYLQEAADRALE